MFLTSTTVINPVNPKSTSQPNFFKDPSNFGADESISLVKNIRLSDLKKSNIILDLSEKRIVKCRRFFIDGKSINNPTYHEIYDYYHSQFPTQIDQAISI
jgi:hypothetical protein